MFFREGDGSHTHSSEPLRLPMPDSGVDSPGAPNSALHSLRSERAGPSAFWALIFLSRVQVCLHGHGAPAKDNRYGVAAGAQRSNPSFHDHHHRPAAGTQDRRPLFQPGHRLARDKFEQHMQQGDQALAVGMQKTEVARSPEALGQHMLQDQPEEIRAGQSALLGPPGLGVLIAEADLAVAAGDDVLLANDAAIEIAPEIVGSEQPVSCCKQRETGCSGSTKYGFRSGSLLIGQG